MKTDVIVKEPKVLTTDSDMEKIITANDKLPPNSAKQALLLEQLMEMKRERDRSSKEQRILYLNVGMVISLLLVITVINWNFVEDQGLVELGQLKDDAEEIIEIPISRQPPPPPPAKIPEVFVIKVVPDEEIVEEIELNLDVEIGANEVSEQFEYTPIMEEEKEVVEEIFTIVETAPEPVGGYAAFHKYIAESLKYPTAAERLNVSGKVFVKFVVEKDGSLTDLEVVKGIGAGCDEEAVRVIAGAPKWNPGKQRGQPVRVSKIIPIRFILVTN